jgi:hypothetical protein
MYLAYVDVDWPTSFINFFRWTGIANLMILDIAPLDCISGSRISYYSKITFHTLIMPITALIFLAVYIGGSFFLKWYVMWLPCTHSCINPHGGRDAVGSPPLGCCFASPC